MGISDCRFADCRLKAVAMQRAREAISEIRKSEIRNLRWLNGSSTPATASAISKRRSPFTRTCSAWRRSRRHTSPRGSELVFFKAPGSEEEIEICKFDGSGPVNVGNDITHLAFEVDDLEAFAKHAAAQGLPAFRRADADRQRQRHRLYRCAGRLRDRADPAHRKHLDGIRLARRALSI